MNFISADVDSTQFFGHDTSVILPQKCRLMVNGTAGDGFLGFRSDENPWQKFVKLLLPFHGNSRAKKINNAWHHAHASAY